MDEENFLMDIVTKESYDVRNFKENLNEWESISPLLKKERYIFGQQILDRYQYNQEIKIRREYKELWLYMSETVNEPEEVFVFMHVNDLGKNFIELYKRWISLYINKKEFVLSYQLINLIRGDFHEKHINELSVFLENEVCVRLSLDFYSRKNHVSVNVGEEFSFELEEDDGINEDDFNKIRDIDIKERIKKVESAIFTSSLISSPGHLSSPKKNKSQRKLNFSKKKRYSDLINMKSFHDDSVYIGRECRSDNIEKLKLLVFEYEYYKKKYKDYDFEKSPHKNSDEYFFDFWIKKQNNEKIKQLINERKILRLYKKKSSLKKSSKRNSKIKKKSPKVSIDPFSNKINDIRKKFDFKKFDDDDFFNIESTKGTLDFDTNQLFSNSNHFFESKSSAFGNNNLFNFFEMEKKNKLLKLHKKINVKDRIIKELPRSENSPEIFKENSNNFRISNN